MRIRSFVAALALTLAVGLASAQVALVKTAEAQTMDGGVDFGGGFATPATMQALLFYQLYGLQQQQIDALPEADRQAMAKRAVEYFTNGAEVTGVPTSGPGAAYFQNGAGVTAASTANAVPFGESAFPPPAEASGLSADASAASPALAATADASSPSDAAAPTASATPRRSGDAGMASPAPSSGESAATTANGSVPTQALGSPEAMASSTALAGLEREKGATADTSADSGGWGGWSQWLTPVYARLSPGWLLPVLAGLGAGSLAIFFGFRAWWRPQRR